MRLRLNVGKTLPSVLLVGKKDSGVPMFEIRNHAGDTMFAIDEEVRSCTRVTRTATPNPSNTTRRSR